MARYLFITWDGSGNLTPTLGAAQALREHGHGVAFIGYESQQVRSNAAFRLPADGNKIAAMVAGV